MGIREQHWRKLCTIEALTEQGGTCKYCKAPLTAKEATADHMWPVSKRGRTTRENIVAACRSCNVAKGNMGPAEFYRLIDRKFPKGQRMEILLIWVSRRIWRRTHRATERIERLAR